MTPERVFCLFEQSGTFKNEFIKLGYPAEDCDILNDFGETDHVMDLFAEIEAAYKRERETIFDGMMENDLIMAFFPCTYFSGMNCKFVEGRPNFRSKSKIEIIEYCAERNAERNRMYQLFSELYIICMRNNLKCIIENPATPPHYLTMYFPMKAKLVDGDRRERGDYFKKPTQYWFINFEPQNRIVLEPVQLKKLISIKRIKKDDFSEYAKDRQKARSMISPEYANRFIREFILDE